MPAKVLSVVLCCRNASAWNKTWKKIDPRSRISWRETGVTVHPLLCRQQTPFPLITAQIEDFSSQRWHCRASTGPVKCLHAGCHKCCIHRRCSEEIGSGWCTISKQGCPGNQEEFGRDVRALLKQDINNVMPSDVTTQTQNAMITGGDANRTIQCYTVQHKNSPSFVDINPEQYCSALFWLGRHHVIAPDLSEMRFRPFLGRRTRIKWPWWWVAERLGPTPSSRSVCMISLCHVCQ